MKRIKLFEEFSPETEQDKKEVFPFPEGPAGMDVDEDTAWMEAEGVEELDEKADPLVVTSKDVMRAEDIFKKSGFTTSGGGDLNKAKMLTQTMCKLITDKFKALRRGRAMQSLVKVHEEAAELADLFFKRAMDLGAHGG